MDGFDLFRYLPLAFVAFGLFYAANGVRALLAGRRFERAAHRAEGTVVDVRSRVVRRSSSSGRGSRSRTIHIPVVRFAIPDGRTVETESGAARASRRRSAPRSPCSTTRPTPRGRASRTRRAPAARSWT